MAQVHRQLLELLALLLSFFALGYADGSVFVAPLAGSANLTFAISTHPGSHDLEFHLSGPTLYSWIAVGTGRSMESSLMFVVYQNSTGNGVTFSPRFSNDYSEPAYSSTIIVEVAPDTGLFQDTMIVRGRCRNCRNSQAGVLSMHNTKQPWIFAVGPISTLSAGMQSDSKTESIERHSEYGTFTMDMVQASSDNGVLQQPLLHSTGSSRPQDVTRDFNWASVMHALLATVSFVLLMPLGVIFLRVAPRSVRWHQINQTIAILGAALGTVFGIYLSNMFTKSSSFDTLHQILGLLLAVFVLVQWAIGFWHHHLYKKFQTPTKFGLVHRHMGRAVVLLAIANGGIGLAFARASRAIIIGYGLAAVFIALTTLGLIMWKRRKVSGETKGDQIQIVHEPAIEMGQYGQTSDRDALRSQESIEGRIQSPRRF